MVRLRLDLLSIINFLLVINFTRAKVDPKPVYNCTHPNIVCTNGTKTSFSSSILEVNSSLSYSRKLISDGGNFTVGFFVRAKNVYLGTWYTSSSPEEVIVWVANRDNPIPSRLARNCSLVLGKDGVAMVLDSNNQSYWSTNHTKASNPSLSDLQILDNGNLVLRDRGNRGRIFWQSFDHPTDTFLFGMDVVNLTSWKNPNFPGQGNYMLQNGEGTASNILSMFNLSQSFTKPYWDSSFTFLPPNLTAFLTNAMTGDSVLRLVMNSTARIQLWKLDDSRENWSMIWEAPKDQCDLFNNYGSFGVCDSFNSFKCKCLPGYYPSDPVQWESMDFSGGCSKKSTSQCGKLFSSLPMIKLPPPTGTTTYLAPVNEALCKNQCLSDCQCKAYTYDSTQSTFLIWNDGLSHIQEEYYSLDAVTLYVRLDQLDIIDYMCS